MKERERIAIFGRENVLTDAEMRALKRRGWWFREGKWWHLDADEGDKKWFADIDAAKATGEVK